MTKKHVLVLTKEEIWTQWQPPDSWRIKIGRSGHYDTVVLSYVVFNGKFLNARGPKIGFSTVWFKTWKWWAAVRFRMLSWQGEKKICPNWWRIVLLLPICLDLRKLRNVACIMNIGLSRSVPCPKIWHWLTHHVQNSYSYRPPRLPG